MNTLPEFWCIRNIHQEVRDWFAKEYELESLRKWNFPYIGYDGCTSNNGVHGCQLLDFYKKNIEISLEDFKRLVLKTYEIY